MKPVWLESGERQLPTTSWSPDGTKIVFLSNRVGGARLENMLVVTKDGAEIMDYFPRDEILVAPR